MNNTILGFDMKTAILICTLALIIIINALYNSQKNSINLQEGMDATNPNSTDSTNLTNSTNLSDTISPTTDNTPNTPNTPNTLNTLNTSNTPNTPNTPIIPNTSMPSITAVAPPLTVPHLNITQISPQKLRSKCITNCYASYPSKN